MLFMKNLLYIKTKQISNAMSLLYWILPRGKRPLSAEVRENGRYSGKNGKYGG